MKVSLPPSITLFSCSQAFAKFPHYSVLSKPVFNKPSKDFAALNIASDVLPNAMLTIKMEQENNYLSDKSGRKHDFFLVKTSDKYGFILIMVLLVVVTFIL